MEVQVGGRRREDAEARQLAEGWHRGGGTITTRDALSALILGVGYATATLAITASSRLVRGVDLVTLAFLVGLYAIAYNTEFESAAGSAVPTEPVLVGMLFLLPRQLVPLTVLIALLVAPGGRDREQGPLWRTLVIRAGSGWHCLGPVLVLWSRGRADLADWPWYVAALGAQFALDGTVALIRSWAIGVRARDVAGPMAWTFATDALLAPFGLAAVIAAREGRTASFILLGSPVVLTWLLAYDRRVQVRRSLSLGEAVVTAEVEARTDHLTSVGNRRAWQEALEQAEAYVVEGPHRRATMALLDLDDLKRTNDTLGHTAGDLLIAAAGSMLLEVAPPGATVARIGGDEFAVLIVGEDEVPTAEALGEAVRQAIERRVPVHGAVLRACVGTSSCPPAPTVAIAAQWADAGVYAEKAVRRQRA